MFDKTIEHISLGSSGPKNMAHFSSKHWCLQPFNSVWHPRTVAVYTVRAWNIIVRYKHTAGAVCISLQIFSTPYHHPKSQPFIDHVITFSVLDDRIWFRNFQILSEDGALAEIGPRFVLNPIKIFDGSFQGQTIWENPRYVSPALVIYILCYLMSSSRS